MIYVNEIPIVGYHKSFRISFAVQHFPFLTLYNITGLDLLHEITVLQSYQLRIDFEDWDGNTSYAVYRNLVSKFDAA